MSIEARLNKLEERNTEFVVCWPIYLNRDGNKIPWSFEINEDDIEAVKFKGSRKGGYVVDRLQDEPFEEFSNRAHRNAAEELDVKVFLHSCSEEL